MDATQHLASNLARHTAAKIFTASVLLVLAGCGDRSDLDRVVEAYDRCSKLPGAHLELNQGSEILAARAEAGTRRCLFQAMGTPESIKNDIETTGPASPNFPSRSDGGITYSWGYDASDATVNLIISAGGNVPGL